uniref:separase n=2 Tax=Lutzomyia longipalpis TaxID=7200 RepID=A0A1B0CLT1_LUTLO
MSRMPRKPPKETIPIKLSAAYSPGKAKNTVKDDASFRGTLLHRANELYGRGKVPESVECQIEALCMGFRTKFFSCSDRSDSLDYDMNMKFIDDLEALNAGQRDPPEFTGPEFDVLNEALSEVVEEFRKSTKTSPLDAVEYESAGKLIEKCRELPEEWTVLHLCKDFNANSVNSLQSEVISSNGGIYLTLLKYERSELNHHEPICVFLPALKEVNIFEMMQDVAKRHEKYMTVNPGTDKTIYWANLKLLNQDYFNLIQLLINWLGPWITFFLGRMKEERDVHEKIFTIVDDFAKAEKLNPRQRILLSLICCNRDLLDRDSVEVAAKEISQSTKEKRKIQDFLSNEKIFPDFTTSLRFPILLIVDELLDQFPWEMVLPEMETARVSSLHMLMRLYDKYKDQIVEGYLQLNLEKGITLINPQGDLLKMQRRMDTLNCVVLLFGCDSIRLKAEGFCSEMTGAHLYYHYVLCPLVIGATNVITDFPTDQLSARILSSWFKSTASRHFAFADEKSFKEGKIEWTVLHLCKDFNANSVNSLQSEVISSNGGIYLTLLKYERSELNHHEPICVFLPALKEENIFEMMQDVAKRHEKYMTVNPGTDKTIYWANLKQLDQDYFNLIQLLINWLGPWITFFLGRMKEERDVHEKIFTIVDDFAKAEKLNPRQRILLSLICCNRDLLDGDSVEIFPDFTTSLRFPILLIVDELLDQFPWEMVLPEMETARVSSLHMLMRLYDKYKDQIVEGYLQLNLEKGITLINPQGDLLKMQRRMVEFFTYWLPEWQQNVQKIPTSEELRRMLESSDIFVYCGHGNALKYIKPMDLIKDTLNCVVLLFGCDSIRLKAEGFCSEMTGAHLYYHYVLCPLVIGATNVITDFPTDQLSARILSSWFKSTASKHFAFADEKSFKEGKIEFKKNSKPAWENLHNPSILGIFADIRNSEKLALFMRASVILRGLPIWQGNGEKSGE